MTIPEKAQVLADPSDDFYISLSKLTGKKVVDLHGYLDSQFGTPVFHVCRVAFEDGTTEFLEGEHDVAYLADVPGFTDEELEEMDETWGE